MPLISHSQPAQRKGCNTEITDEGDKKRSKSAHRSFVKQENSMPQTLSHLVEQKTTTKKSTTAYCYLMKIQWLLKQ